MLSIGDASNYFAIPFCVFNSMQGFFIFILHNVRIENVRKAWLWAFSYQKQGKPNEHELKDENVMFISNPIYRPKRCSGKGRLMSTNGGR